MDSNLFEQAVFEFLSSVIVDLCSVCPQCSTAVNVRRAVCGCGHAFPSKRKAQSGNAMKHSTMNARASETPEQTLNMRETDKVRKTRNVF